MKQEYTDKMKYYQGKEYENFLREKCVLDARQFLYSSQLYMLDSHDKITVRDAHSTIFILILNKEEFYG